MKTAKEWLADLDIPTKEREETRSISARQIQIIQSDAFNTGFAEGLEEAIRRIKGDYNES